MRLRCSIGSMILAIVWAVFWIEGEVVRRARSLGLPFDEAGLEMSSVDADVSGEEGITMDKRCASLLSFLPFWSSH